MLSGHCDRLRKILTLLLLVSLDTFVISFSGHKHFFVILLRKILLLALAPFSNFLTARQYGGGGGAREVA